MNAWYRDKKRSVLVSAPTGAGKTIIFSSLIHDVADGTSNRVLVLVHRDTILSQTVEKLKFVWPDASIGTIKGKHREYDKQITVASVQTLSGRIEEFVEACTKHGEITHCVMDEAHHSYSRIWRKIFYAFKAIGTTKFLGVSATPFRENKKESLADIFEDVVYSISVFSLIKEHFLSAITAYTVSTPLSLAGVKITRGDFNIRDLNNKLFGVEKDPNNLDRTVGSIYNMKIVEAWKEKAKNRKTICFAVSIQHIETLVDEFNKAGARVIGIHGELPVEQQRTIIEEFSSGRYNVIVNCQLLTEGFDLPAIDCVLMGRPTFSRTLYTQMLGRGIRPSPGKRDCLLIDFTSNTETNSMVTMQDLLAFYGMKRAADIYQKKIDQDMTDKNVINKTEFSSKTIPLMEAVDKFGHEISTSNAYQEIDIFDNEAFTWTEMDGNQFVSVRRNLSIAVYRYKDKYIPYLLFTAESDRCIAKISEEPVEKEFAMAIANVYVFEYGHRSFVKSDMQWRESSPTQRTDETLKKAVERYKQYHPGTTLSIANIKQTQGSYSDLITALYCTGYINNKKTQIIDRDTALEKLKRMVMQEMGIKYSETERKKDDTDFKDMSLDVTGDYTSSDKRALYSMIISLRNDPKSHYPASFLAENPIEIDDAGYLKVHS